MAVNRRDFRGFEIEIGPGIILKVVDVKFIGVVGGMKLASEYVHLGVINDGGMSPPRSRGGHPVLGLGSTGFHWKGGLVRVSVYISLRIPF